MPALFPGILPKLSGSCSGDRPSAQVVAEHWECSQHPLQVTTWRLSSSVRGILCSHWRTKREIFIRRRKNITYSPTTKKIFAPPLELLSLNRQEMLNICTSTEDTVQVHPSSLYVNPYIKQGIDSIQLVFPRQSFFLKFLKRRLMNIIPANSLFRYVVFPYKHEYG